MAFGDETSLPPAPAGPSMTTAFGLLAIAVGLVAVAQLPSMRKNGRKRRGRRMRRNGVRQAHGGWVAYQTDAQGRDIAGFGPYPTKARAQAALDERTKLAKMSQAERVAYAWGPRGAAPAAKPRRAKAKSAPAKRASVKAKPKAAPRARPKKKKKPGARGFLTSIERLLSGRR